ncbi:MAG TPA: Hsp20/alpha crystallin family protein [Luteolibacter sp.]
MNRLITHPLLSPSLDRLFDRAFEAFAPSPEGRFHEHLDQNDQSHVMRIDLPGLRKEDIRLDLNDRALTVTAESPADRPFALQYRRTWALGPEIDTTGISARLELGVLELTLPKVAPAERQPRTIEIQTVA